MRKFFSASLILLLLFVMLSGCGALKGKNAGESNDNSIDYTGETAAPAEEAFAASAEDMFSDRDGRADYDESAAVKIQLNGATATTTDQSVKVEGGRITLTAEGVYIVSGTLDEGALVVKAPDTAKLQVVFRNVSISCATSTPLYIVSADKVFLTLEGESSLACGTSFVSIDENNIDGALYSKQDLTVNGSGTLTVSSPAGHGIVCKDDLVLSGGVLNVTAASHAIDANDSVRIREAELTLSAGKDGIHAENADDSTRGFVYILSGSLEIAAEGDGVSASAHLQLDGGELEISAGGGYENGREHSSAGFGGFPGGGGSGMRPPRTMAAATTEQDDSTSMKGLKCGTGMLISNGSIKINSADDALHSNGTLTVNGGSLELASGDDALHAEDTLTVTAGSISITNSYEGLEAQYIYLRGGDIKLVATDDGLNAAGGTDSSGEGGRDGMFGGHGGGMGAGGNGSIEISGGALSIKASGDGIDANGTLLISGGYTTVTGPTQGDTATLDYDKSGSITGGIFVGTGASGGMAQTFSSSEQGVISVQVGNQTVGTAITLKDSQGNILVSHSPELSFAVVIISTPDIVSGQEYTLTVGSQTEKFKAS